MPEAAQGRALNTRKGRTAPTVQPSTNFFSSNDAEDNLNQLQVQRLGERACITPALASVLAPLVFGRAAA